MTKPNVVANKKSDSKNSKVKTCIKTKQSKANKISTVVPDGKIQTRTGKAETKPLANERKEKTLPRNKQNVEKPVLPDYYFKKTAIPCPLVALDAIYFMRMPIPKAKFMLGKWLPEKSLSMIHAPRGCGKTYLALWIAHAVASGNGLFNWEGTEPKKVLYMDGEMPSKAFQLRNRAIHKKMKSMPGMLKVVTPDFQEGIIPDLATNEGLEMINSAIDDDTRLIIVDNISCWTKSGREDAETWAPTAEWALRHRSEGRSILFIHHSGKNKLQRGTSRREDLLDVVMGLRHPAGTSSSDGASFEIHFEKNRHFFGEDAAPIKAQLIVSEDGQQDWEWEVIENPINERMEKIMELKAKVKNQSTIAKMLNISPSTVSRALSGGKK